MKHIFSLMFLFVTTFSVAQQINPVPDYIFRNQMSVGRNAATDSLAYFSIGPKYGANKGFMPPMVVDTALVTGAAKRNGLLIFSIQKNKFLYWDSVRVRWSDMAGSSGAYITGSGTVNYVPKFTASDVLGNSAMYDSSGFLKVYSNNIGNVQNFDFQNLVGKLNLVKDGILNYGLVIQQNDSVRNGLQLVANLRKGLLTNDTVQNGHGVGIDFGLQSNTKRWRRSGWIVNRTVDSAEATFKADMAFMVNSGGNFIYPLIVRPDSTIRVLRLAGSGTRNVVADANGDLRVGSGSDGIDSVLFSTRAWRQKGDDSVAAIANAKVGGSGTTNYVPKFTGSGTIGNGIMQDNGSTVFVSGSMELQNSGEFRWKDATGTGQNVLMMFSDNNVYLSSPVASSNMIFRGVGFAERMRITSTGNVGIGTTAPDNTLSVDGTISTGGVGANLGVQIIPVISTALPSSSVKSIIGSLNSGYGFTAGTLYMQPRTGVSAPMVFGTEGAERMRLTSAGRLLVGTTTEGTNTVDIAGTLRSTQGANFATSSGSVGIGTTSPTTTLQVNGNTSITSGTFPPALNALHLYFRTDINTGFIDSHFPGTAYRNLVINGENLLFNTRDVERMRIDAVGQVGIGTTSPTRKLDITGGNAIISNASAANDAAYSILSTSAGTDVTLGGVGLGINLYPSATGSNRYVQIISGDNVAFRNLILSANNVGIGSTSPDSRLFVVGDGDGRIRIGSGVGGNSANIGLTGAISSTNYTLSGDAGNNNVAINRPTGGAMSFRSNNAAQMTLTSGGRLLIGTEGDNGDFKLQVSGNAYIQNETILGATGDLGAYTLQVTGDAIFDGAIVTQEPGGGIANKIPWKLGNVNNVSPTSPNRTITVLINGTTYYIHAKTTND